jgi:hypothetical protein
MCLCRFFQLETEGFVQRGGPHGPRPLSRSTSKKPKVRQRPRYTSDSDLCDEEGEDYDDISDQEAMVEGPDGMLRPQLHLRKTLVRFLALKTIVVRYYQQH